MDSGGDTSTHLDFLADFSNRCSAALADDSACGIVSPVGLTPSPWAFTDKGGNVNQFDNGELFEAGINLSSPDINLGGECFATVVSETRSSTSPTATLKDFVVSNFGRCTSSITSAQNWTPNDSATVNVGGKATWTGNVTFTLHSSSTCADAALYTQPAQPVSNVTPTVSTNNSTYKVSAAGPTTVYWKVFFQSTTSGVPDSTTCTESSTLSIDNDTTSP